MQAITSNLADAALASSVVSAKAAMAAQRQAEKLDPDADELDLDLMTNMAGAARIAREAADRFIPAGAGNRMAFMSFSLMFAVHPRWRGEQRPPAASDSTGFGSSPLARGTAMTVSSKLRRWRFIPAGAGNSF